MKYPLSMTGFGRGEKNDDAGRNWTVELRSVNHRFLDIRVKITHQFAELEDFIKKEISRFYSRGHIEISVGIAGGQATAPELQVNLSLARQYRNCLYTLRQGLNLTTDHSNELELISGFKDVIIAVDRQENIEKVRLELQQALNQALENSLNMREQEGENLKKDLLARLGVLSATIDDIEEVIPLLLSKKEQSLKQRLDKLLAGIDLDPQRLAQEVAIIADKADITEEIVRLKSHISQFENFLGLAEPVGRRLDFLLQEFLREINTMASKIADADTAHLTVALKNEVEKMREQVQNLE
jgi:uncharacterized protein (TIGR00255 family)